MHIYLVRHGQTEENIAQILQGHMPGTLTELGKEQVRATAEKLAQLHVDFQTIVSSDLQRTVDSSQLIQRQIPIPIVQTSLLRERDWGSYTGICISEAKEKYYHDKKWDFPVTERPVETEEELAIRARKALDFLSDQFAHQTVIVVTHGLFARCLIAACNGCSFHETTPLANAEIRVLTI